MKLPGVQQAIVDEAKVRDYLLSLEHPIGRFKAMFFGAQGSAFGQKYKVRGILEGPSGGRAEIVTVWIVLDGEAAPRLVTAFPGEAR